MHIEGTPALLNLLQLTDSFFPSGSFAYSWGLETCVSEGLVEGVDGLGGFLAAYLKGQLARSDALVAKLAFDAAGSGDLAAVVRLDNKLNAMKTARECREGGLQIGKQILKVVNALHRSAFLGEFAGSIEARKSRGHHAPVFGVVCRVLGVAKRDCMQGFLYQAASGIVSAGVRLIPLGHMDGQAALEQIKPLMVGIADEIEPLGEDDISSFAPGIEIRAMRHETLYTRLFRS
jgi:urease accessory protein